MTTKSLTQKDHEHESDAEVLNPTAYDCAQDPIARPPAQCRTIVGCIRLELQHQIYTRPVKIQVMVCKGQLRTLTVLTYTNNSSASI